MPESEHLISVKNLVKTYQKADKNAVDDVSFYVDEGSLFSLLGPNGAGKTTTISILTTTLSKTSGEVMIDGFDINKDASAVRQQIGVIFQNPSLDLNLTAEENVRFHTNLYQVFPYRPSFSLMPKAYQKKVKELAEVLGIEKDMFKPVKTFSGGMKRKLELVRSLTHNPKVLFLDEPTTGLDPVSRKSLWEYLQVMRKKEGVTMFLTTHYLEEAEGSDYICIIDHGKIVAKGTTQEIKDRLLESYLSIDAEKRDELMNELTSQHVDFTGKGPLKIRLDGTPAPQIIQHLKTPLNFMDMHNPSLEEAYIGILKKDHQA